MIEEERGLKSKEKIKELEDKINENRKVLLDLNNSLICLCEIIDTKWWDPIDAISHFFEWAHAEKRFLTMNNDKLKSEKHDSKSLDQQTEKKEVLSAKKEFWDKLDKNLEKYKEDKEKNEISLELKPLYYEHHYGQYMKKNSFGDEKTNLYETSDNMVRRMKVNEEKNSKSLKIIKAEEIFGSGSLQDQKEFNKKIKVSSKSKKEINNRKK